VPIQPSGHFLAVDLDAHACAVRADHTLWCWGAGKQGQLGDGGGADRASPVQVGRETTWAAVTVGVGWTCGVRQDGNQLCWGAARR
jgi:alpha-tubulin suppressor-like RCC1 family protein